MQTPLSAKELRALRLIQQSFATKGRAPSVRELARAMGYRSPRSAAQVLTCLAGRGLVQRGADGRLRLLKAGKSDRADNAHTVAVPLVGSVACGQPLYAEENIEAVFQVSVDLARPPHTYFLLRATGNSMDEAGIEDGALVLVRQQQTANDGDRVVALIDDEATIKILKRSQEATMLCPRSSNTAHKPVVLTRDFTVQGVVVASLPVDEGTSEP